MSASSPGGFCLRCLKGGRACRCFGFFALFFRAAMPYSRIVASYGRRAHTSTRERVFRWENGTPQKEMHSMRKPISPKMHGALDYTTSAAVAAAPRLMRMPKKAELLFDSLAAGYTGLSAITDYPLSVKRVA